MNSIDFRFQRILLLDLRTKSEFLLQRITIKIFSGGVNPLPMSVDYIRSSFFNKNSNIGLRESKIENPTKSPNEPPIDPNIPNPS